MNGSVYLMGCQGLIKAGKSIKPSLRRKGHQTGNPFPVRILKTWRVADMHSAESDLKAALSVWRIRGEWYQPPPEIRAFLLNLRCLETYFATGADAQEPPKETVPTIPQDYPGMNKYHAIFSPRSTIFHHVVRRGEKIVSLCGDAEMSPAHYWWMQGRNISLSFRHRICETCEALAAKEAA